MAEPQELEKLSDPASLPKTESGVRKWLPQLRDAVVAIITLRERVEMLATENSRLRDGLQRVAETVAKHGGELEQINIRIDQAVELHVLKALQKHDV